MKTITIDNIEYELTPVTKFEWTKHTIHKDLEWGPVSDKEMTWEKAKKWCEGQGGRLPTSAELLAAYEDKVDGFHTKSYFWSATTCPYTGGQGYAMRVGFDIGYVYNGNKTVSYYVRCVRG